MAIYVFILNCKLLIEPDLSHGNVNDIALDIMKKVKLNILNFLYLLIITL